MKEDIGWINYIITHMTNVTGDYKKQVDAMREQILLVDLNTIPDVKLRENVAATIELIKSK